LRAVGGRRRRVAWAVIVLALATSLTAHAQEGFKGALDPEKIPHTPGTGPVTAESEGQSQNQPVREPPAEVKLDLTGAKNAHIGGAYVLEVAVHNTATAKAKNVRVRVSLGFTAADGSGRDAATIVRYAGATAMQCTAYNRDRVCALGDIPANETRTGRLLVDIAPTAGSGNVTFSATARIDNRAGGSEPTDRMVVALASTSRAVVDVDLDVTIERGAEKVRPGLPFLFVIRVRNGSDRHAAMATELEISQRFGERAAGKFQPVNGGVQTKIRGDNGAELKCFEAKRAVRCPLGTIAAGSERRVTVEDVVVRELGRGRWGRVEVHARARSAEHDPTINFAKTFTNVLSRVPDVAVFARGRDEHGEPGIVPVATVAIGGTFGIAARFMDVAAEPASAGIRVKLLLPGAASPIEVPLEPGDSDRLFRSQQIRLLLPGERPAAGDTAGTIVRAPIGARIKVIYDHEGVPAAETVVIVRPRTSSSR
jgi:hypothetical protein